MMYLRPLISGFVAAFSMAAITQAVAAPIHEAAHAGDLAAIEQMIDSGANIPLGTALHHAVAAGHAEVVELLLSRGANVNAMSGTDSSLHLAILSDRAIIVERLIAAGADVNATLGEGNTPLHYAAQSGSVALAELLIDNGADVKARRVRSGTPTARRRSGRTHGLGRIANREWSCSAKDRSRHATARDSEFQCRRGSSTNL